MKPPRPTGAEPCRKRPELFFADDSNVQRVEAAKNMCRSGCPIFDRCLAWSLRHEAHGVWGGASAGERADARRRLGIDVQQPRVSEWIDHQYRQAAS